MGAVGVPKHVAEALAATRVHGALLPALADPEWLRRHSSVAMDWCEVIARAVTGLIDAGLVTGTWAVQHANADYTGLREAVS